MPVMKDLADTPAGALRNLPGTLGRADANVLRADDGSFAYIADCVNRMQSDKITGTLTNALGGCPNPLAGTFADVPGSAAYVASWAAPGRDGGGRLRGWRGLGGLLGVLGASG